MKIRNIVDADRWTFTVLVCEIVATATKLTGLAKVAVKFAATLITRAPGLACERRSNSEHNL